VKSLVGEGPPRRSGVEPITGKISAEKEAYMKTAMGKKAQALRNAVDGKGAFVFDSEHIADWESLAGGAEDRWLDKVFKIGVKMMKARVEDSLAEGEVEPSQPASYEGLDRHAFAYCWLVAQGAQFFDCKANSGFWNGKKCNNVVPADEFFGPPMPNNPDSQGALARVRSKLLGYSQFAAYNNPKKKNVVDLLSERIWTHQPPKDAGVSRHDWVKFWHTLNAEKMPFTKLKEMYGYQQFLTDLFDAAVQTGWNNAAVVQFPPLTNNMGDELADDEAKQTQLRQQTSEAKLEGMGFHYMSLLADEFRCGKKQDVKAKYPDHLQLLTEIEPGVPNFPYYAGDVGSRV